MLVEWIARDQENDFRGFVKFENFSTKKGAKCRFYLNDSQHDDNDKKEESNIEGKSPIEIFVTRWIKFVTNTTTSSNTSI